jgi:hypothetical protein
VRLRNRFRLHPKVQLLVRLLSKVQLLEIRVFNLLLLLTI